VNWNLSPFLLVRPAGHEGLHLFRRRPGKEVVTGPLRKWMAKRKRAGIKNPLRFPGAEARIDPLQVARATGCLREFAGAGRRVRGLACFDRDLDGHWAAVRSVA
jgi:hypothetical protein